MRVVVPLLLVVSVLGAVAATTRRRCPKGVTFRVEQTRQDLQGRSFQLQVVNESRQHMTVEHVDESGRLDKAAGYDGPTTVLAGTKVNLTMMMPLARCGSAGSMPPRGVVPGATARP